MPESVCGPRVEELGRKLNQLDARREELADDANQVAAPDAYTLAALAAEVREVVEHGDVWQRKALLPAYVREIRVLGSHAVYPSFYVPIAEVRPPSGSVLRLAAANPRAARTQRLEAKESPPFKLSTMSDAPPPRRQVD